MPLLNIPDELIELRSSLRQFLDREVRPIEDEHRQEIQETGVFEGLKDVRAKLRKRSAELGFWTLHMPEEASGGGLSYLGQVLLHEAEPGAGSDATRIQTRAERGANGAWVVNGRKHFITGAEEAEFALVFAVTDSQKRAKGGITAFFVDADQPGYSVTRVQRTMSPYQNPVEITFEDVEVGDEQILGREGFGFYSAVKGINGARLQIAARALGLGQHLLDRMIEYANSRVAFGQPIGKNQYVQSMVVDSFAELEQARLLVYQCAQEIDDGADGRRQAALAKLVSTEMVGRVADRAIQVHGGNGFMTELGLEAWYRDVRAIRLYEGTTEILKSNVAKTLGL